MEVDGVKWLSTAEMRQKMGISNSTVYKILRTGEVRTAKVASRVWIDPASLDLYIRNHIIEPTAVVTFDDPLAVVDGIPRPVKKVGRPTYREEAMRLAYEAAVRRLAMRGGAR